ncbi:MAG: holo-ACP synthase [Burkholderiaceae bacterium]|nr:holo-ACP synthase [Burkholderiaceae bacterium]
MVAGLGCDIVEIDRIQKAYSDRGKRFAEVVLSEEELKVFEERYTLSPERGIRYIAGRWAAKEAFSKAMGTGVRGVVRLRDISVLNNELGAPYLKFSGALEAEIKEKRLRFFLSISDSTTVSMAFVVSERID